MSTKSLQAAIMQALDESNSQNPVVTEDLYTTGTMYRVQCALLDLYHAQQINCCKVEKGGKETILWWKTGACLAHVEYGKPGRKAV